jgi:hypothetical protein
MRKKGGIDNERQYISYGAQKNLKAQKVPGECPLVLPAWIR